MRSLIVTILGSAFIGYLGTLAYPEPNTTQSIAIILSAGIGGFFFGTLAE